MLYGIHLPFSDGFCRSEGLFLNGYCYKGCGNRTRTASDCPCTFSDALVTPYLPFLQSALWYVCSPQFPLVGVPHTTNHSAPVLTGRSIRFLEESAFSLNSFLSENNSAYGSMCFRFLRYFLTDTVSDGRCVPHTWYRNDIVRLLNYGSRFL